MRLPGALAIMALTLCLFRFDGNIDRLNSSFLASLLFLSSMLIMNLTFQASETIIPASLFILALMSLYHWLNHPSKRYFWLVVATAAISTVLIGATSPIALALMAYVFIIASKRYSVKSYLTITLALLLSCAMAFLAIYVLVGDTSIAMDIFDIRQQLAMSPEASMANAFFEYIVLALFPWSIPLIISTPWLVRNPRWIYDKFLNLGLLERYSIIIFYSRCRFYFSPPTSRLSCSSPRCFLTCRLSANTSSRNSIIIPIMEINRYNLCHNRGTFHDNFHRLEIGIHNNNRNLLDIDYRRLERLEPVFDNNSILQHIHAVAQCKGNNKQQQVPIQCHIPVSRGRNTGQWLHNR